MNTKTQLETLAVMFRVLDPNLGHVSTLEKMTAAGFAYMHGYFMGIPKHHRNKRRAIANGIAEALDRKAARASAERSLEIVLGNVRRAKEQTTTQKAA